MTLYELSSEFRQILDDLEEVEDGEPTEATVALLQEVEADIKNKADNYCSLIRYYQSMAQSIKDELERLTRRMDAKANKAHWLKERLKAALESMGETKIETPLNSVRISQNGGAQPLTIQLRPEELPERFRLVAYQPNKDEIRRALKAGETIPGCQLMERGNHLRIT